MQAKRKRNDSWAWASLLHGRDILRKGGRWIVGNGESRDVEADNWLASGAKERLRNEGVDIRVRELIDQNQKGWDIRKVREIIDPSSVLQVLQTPLRWTDGNDVLIWPHSKSGEYTVKSGYHIIRGMEQTDANTASTSFDIDKRTWKIIWHLNVPQKIKVFLWKAMHGILDVRDNLARKRIVSSGRCPLCGQENETVEHALLFCSWTRPVRFGLQIQCVPHSVGFTNLAKWFVDSFDKFQGGKDYVMFGGISLACALWVIWKSRNLGVFKGMKPNPMTILIQINTLVNDYLRLLGTKVQNREGHSSRRRFNSQWRPPPKGWHKINVDTSFLLPTGIVISGVVVRDEKGNLLTGCYRRHVAELLTLL